MPSEAYFKRMGQKIVGILKGFSNDVQKELQANQLQPAVHMVGSEPSDPDWKPTELQTVRPPGNKGAVKRIPDEVAYNVIRPKDPTKMRYLRFRFGINIMGLADFNFDDQLTPIHVTTKTGWLAIIKPAPMWKFKTYQLVRPPNHTAESESNYGIIGFPLYKDDSFKWPIHLPHHCNGMRQQQVTIIGYRKHAVIFKFEEKTPCQNVKPAVQQSLL